MSEETRKYIDLIKNYNFSSTAESNVQLISEGLNNILGKHTKNGYIIISSYRGGGEKTDSENKENFEQLKNDVRANGFSFIPVYGGFIENKGEENEIEVKEPSLFIPNYHVASTSPYKEDETIKNMGIELSKKYDQDSFLFKPKGNDDAFYITQNGEIDHKFSGKSINDLTQIYFTDLVKKHSENGKTTKRFSFTENVFINKSPVDLNEAKKRYGELFFNLDKKVLNEQKEILRFEDLVDTEFPIAMGSGTTSTKWDKDALIKKLSNVITHYFFDFDFYYNWTDNKDEYYDIFLKDTLTPMINDIDKTLNTFFSFEFTPSSTRRKELIFKADKFFIDEWFKTNKSISEKLRKEYYDYRKEYSGISLT